MVGTESCAPSDTYRPDVTLSRNPSSTTDAVVELLNSATVRLDRIVVENGNSAQGTVFVDNGSSLILDGSWVSGGDNPSSSTGGGGVRVDPGANLTLVNHSRVVRNTAVLGGGIFVNGGSVTINHGSQVLDDHATDGAGIYATAGSRVSRILREVRSTSGAAVQEAPWIRSR